MARPPAAPSGGSRQKPKAAAKSRTEAAKSRRGSRALPGNCLLSTPETQLNRQDSGLKKQNYTEAHARPITRLDAPAAVTEAERPTPTVRGTQLQNPAHCAPSGMQISRFASFAYSCALPDCTCARRRADCTVHTTAGVVHPLGNSEHPESRLYIRQKKRKTSAESCHCANRKVSPTLTSSIPLALLHPLAPTSPNAR